MERAGSCVLLLQPRLPRLLPRLQELPAANVFATAGGPVKLLMMNLVKVLRSLR